MFTQDISLGTGPTAVTYSLTSVVDGKSIRRDPTTTLAAPKELVISHQISTDKATSIKSDRHSVRFDLTKVDETSGKAVVGSAYFVGVMPRSLITEAEIKALTVLLCEFLTASGNMDKILNGEP